MQNPEIKNLKMKKLFALSLFVFFGIHLNAQKLEGISDLGTYEKNFKKGDVLYDNAQILPALNYFLFAYNYDSTNANINFKIGSLYLQHPTKKHLAENYLEKAVLNIAEKYKDYDASEKRAPQCAILDLGKAYHLNYKFSKAKEYYEKFEKLIDPKDSIEIKILKELELQTEYAIKYVSNPSKIKSTNLGIDVNSEYPDFSPVISADENSIIFTHRGPMFKNDGISIDDGYYFENVVISNKLDGSFPGKWTKPELLTKINSPETHEASVGISADGQILIVYRDDNNDGNLYYTTWNGKSWGELIKFDSDINTKYWEPSACISPDGNSLYFVSDRPGGYGGRDIYRSKKLPNGKWSLATNMGPKINSAFDEESPFITADNSYLYFSTQGHNSMGGFDIVYSRIYEDGITDSIVNLGYPINTPDDDLYFAVSADARRAYYASAHEGGMGEKDIYIVEMELPYPKGLVVLKGKIKPQRKCDSLPTDLSVEITDLTEGSLVGIYRPKYPSGEFLSILNIEKEYEIKYLNNDKEFSKEKIKAEFGLAYQQIEKEIELPATMVDQENKTLPNSKVTLFVYLKDENSKSIGANKDIKLISSEKIELQKTNKNGLVIFKNLKANTKYSIVIDEFSDYALLNENLNTDCLYNNDTLYRTLLLKKKDLLVTNEQNSNNLTNQDLVSTSYQFFFNYNRTNIKNQTNEYQQFVNQLLLKNGNSQNLKIELISSASKVPTHKYKNNENLALSRLNESKKIIENELKAKGITNYTFIKEDYSVNGPEYNSDANKNAKMYKEFQYIIININPNKK